MFFSAFLSEKNLVFINSLLAGLAASHSIRSAPRSPKAIAAIHGGSLCRPLIERIFTIASRFKNHNTGFSSAGGIAKINVLV